MPQIPTPKRHPYDQWSPDSRALDLVGDKWTLLIVRDLASGPRRFVELQRVLPGISTEQLRSRLNRMVADGMLTRQRYREVPPRVDYELTERARDLLPVLGSIARWGYQWAWSGPRAGERVDIGAILRLAGGLLDGDPALHGTVEMTVTDGDREGGSAVYTLKLGDGPAEISEEPADDAAAHMSGDTNAWVKAFSPATDLAELQIAGDRTLAEAVVSHLVQPADPHAPARTQDGAGDVRAA